MDDSARAESMSVLVAGVVFTASLAAVLAVPQEGPGDAGGAAVQRIEAGSLADLLVGSPGVGWPQGPDGIQRLGLANGTGSGLAQSSIDALKGAGLAADPSNGKVDYEEARRSLGLDSQQFRIRIQPIAMAALTANQSLAGVRVAYVADWDGLLTVRLPQGTPDADLERLANVHMNQTSAPTTAQERQALARVGLAFNDRVHIAAAAPTVTVDRPPDTSILAVLGVPHLDGDLYPDRKQYLDAVLAQRLPLYDVLVVGSGVDHSTMSSNAVKEAVHDWVLAGGSLVVLGSGLQGYQWLQPLFSTGVSSVNDLGIDADPSHPILNEPHALAWEGYDSHGRSWGIDDSDSDAFIHVILQGGQDVLAVSKDGAFGDGHVLLTTYLPREIAANQGIQEASHFFENVALFADRSHLYLDYGPPLPPGVPITVAIRQSWLHDDRLGEVPVRVEVAWASP